MMQRIAASVNTGRLAKSLSTMAAQNRGKRRRRGVPAVVEESSNKIMFQSLGCPRNFVDTEVMLGIVLNAGMEVTQSAEEADYLVVNTCGFLQSARDESVSAIQELIETKKEGSKLLVTGCMINLHKDQILNDYPQVDHVLGSGSVDKVLVAIEAMNKKAEQEKSNNIDGVLQEKENDKETISDQRKSFLEQGETPRFIATPRNYAYLKIAEGCRKRCSFCIIPKIKGPLQSKPVEQVVVEFQALLDHGASEVIIIAQDLGDYGKDQKELKKNGLATLLRALLSADDRDFWLRLLYLYPDEITTEIIDIIESDPRICRYLDMPIQHISDVMLKQMKRTTTSKDIKQTIDTLRQRLPGIHIRTSLMVGFPGETEEQFQELLDFVVAYELENVGVFIYSNEELAWSSRLPDHVPQEVKEERYDRLMIAQLEVVQRRNQERVRANERLQVVIEGFHPDHDDLIVGRYYGQCPDIDGQVIINNVDFLGKLPDPGKRYCVELTDFDNYDLIGRIVADNDNR
jgi:ribosomal protein S12 methylthiotransferase